jgi:anti-sigma B factor antagonist
VAPLEFDTTLSDGVAVVALGGELDLSGAGVLEQEIERLAGDSRATTVVLDLRGLDFLDSSGLRIVALADRRLANAGRRLALVRGRETVQRVFDITRMSDRLDFVDDPAAVAGGEAAGP